MSYKRVKLEGQTGVLYTSKYTERFYPDEPNTTCSCCGKHYSEVGELNWYNNGKDNQRLCTKCLIKALKKDKVIYDNWATM